MASIKIRAKAKDGVTTVKTLISHPMDSGLRKNSKTGELIPAYYVTEVTAEHNGKQVMLANWAGAISKNPYLSFKFRGAAAGDMVKITWVDNKGKGDSAEAEIK
jgi:sulfur-oxidizing protein SoxZ